MKTKKIVALMLSLAMVVGFVAACGSTEETTDETTTAASETEAEETEAEESEETEAEGEETEAKETEAEASTGDYTELTVAEVADEGDELVIWDWNDEGVGLVAAYSDVAATGDIVGGSDVYQSLLDAALSSGEEAPDMYFLEADYAKKYMNSSDTLSLNDLGISYSEFVDDMYAYTMDAATDDDGVIKALTWQCTASGVYYNRSVAADTLGVSEPADVAPYFESWDAFLDAARTVNEASKGEKKIVAGYDEIWRSYLNTRTSAWIVDGALNIDPVMDDYFDIAKTLYDEGLTFEASQWGEGWYGGMDNETVLSYWGPMWLANNGCLSLANFKDGGLGDNKTTGDWGMVAAPVDFFWGGTWIAATKYCDMKASAAQVIRDLCIDADNLDAMARAGGFSNSKSVMEAIAGDSSFGYEFLGGQNPYDILMGVADGIDFSTVTPNDQSINDAFTAAVASYVQGDVESVADAKASFQAAVADLGVI